MDELDVSQKILSDIVVHMKYAQYNDEEDRRETWEEIVDRNKEMHLDKFPELEEEIEEAYEYVYDKKVLPSMRSAQFGGKPIKISPNRLYNCAYLPVDSVKSFSETMFLLLGGTGVGYSVQKRHVNQLPAVQGPLEENGEVVEKRFKIGDSIEGWADAVKVLMKAYFKGKYKPDFDYRDIRPKGAPLKTSGGKAPGPEPLRRCLETIEDMLEGVPKGEKITPLQAHDIQCHIADAVLAGGIRRAALISLFDADDQDMMECKSGNWWDENIQRSRANNSVVLKRGEVTKEQFESIWKRTKESNSGEPGFYFTNDKDWGANPCCEIALQAYQFCNLCDVNAHDVKSQEDLEKRAKVAAFIGTLQASYTDFHYLRRQWKKTTEEEALVGVGMTGIASNRVADLDLGAAAQKVKEKNAETAEKLGINKAARTTCVKPSGTSSLVIGCSSGIHAWHNDYYIRRLRVGKNEAIYEYLNNNHPELLEDDVEAPEKRAVISVPLRAPQGASTRHEDVDNLLQRIKRFNLEWVREGHRKGANENNVSATVNIRDEEWEDVKEWLWENRDVYNGISVLPHDGGSYKQAPFEDCDEDTYREMLGQIRQANLELVEEKEDNTDLNGEVACSGGECTVEFL